MQRTILHLHGGNLPEMVYKFTNHVYRKRENKGMQLKALVTHLKCMQVVKHHIVKYAVDPEIQFMYGHMAARQQEGKKQWNGVKELQERECFSLNSAKENTICRQGLRSWFFNITGKRIDQMSS